MWKNCVIQNYCLLPCWAVQSDMYHPFGEIPSPHLQGDTDNSARIFFLNIGNYVPACNPEKLKLHRHCCENWDLTNCPLPSISRSFISSPPALLPSNCPYYAHICANCQSQLKTNDWWVRLLFQDGAEEFREIFHKLIEWRVALARWDGDNWLQRERERERVRGRINSGGELQRLPVRDVHRSAAEIGHVSYITETVISSGSLSHTIRRCNNRYSRRLGDACVSYAKWTGKVQDN
jgi:hypothetical protein